ncbi:MAG TPA: NAD(P)-dependent oxidoreductase [Chloroflexota bacterium]
MVQQRIGYLGMGRMGSAIAGRLLAHGFEVTVWNRTRAKAEALVARGARLGETPADVAGSVDVLMSSLADDDAVRTVYLGPRGALEGARPGLVALELSTISLDLVRLVAGEAARRGVTYLDTPVSGSVPAAEQGQLVVLAGGDGAALEGCRGILQVVGKRTHHLGESGQGMAMKLVVNALLATYMEAIAEVAVLGERLGFEVGTVLRVLDDTAMSAPLLRFKTAMLERRAYPTQFALRLMLKDVYLALDQAFRHRVSMPSTAAVAQVYASGAALRPEEDLAAVLSVLEAAAGEPRAGEG